MDSNKNQITISLNYRTLSLVILALYLLTIGLMLYLWQPWNSISADTRRITVTGEATLEAEPDEFAFRPTYSFESSDKDKALQEASDTTTEIVNELKKLGVEDKDIKVNGYGQDWYWFYNDELDRVSVNIIATVSEKDTAQKVQDYLLTTNPEGQITPTPTFSEAKQKELEEQGRTAAVADAKSKAQISVNELEVKLGKVISVSEGYGFADYPVAFGENGTAVGLDSVEVKRSIPLQPGQDKLSYSVTVVYEIK